MKKKCYKKPVVSNTDINTGLPTLLAIAAVGAAIGAGAVAVGKLVGIDRLITKKLLSNQKIIGISNA